MRQLLIGHKLAWIVLCFFLSLAPAYAFQSFIIHDIEVEGLQRLEKGTVLTYLPVSAGDELNENTARQSIRALYNTGLFKDVTLEKGSGPEGPILVVKVVERPAISSFSITGNKKIGGKDLKKALRDAGLARGELFRRSLLENVEQSLRREYYANGYYGVRIDTDVKHLSNNRVSIEINVKEGDVAKIRSINIVGNHAFSNEVLLDTFKLSTPTALSWLTKNDRYSREKLVGDLEGLTSFYQDRGYLRFSVDSVQVALSPDKRDIYITINVSEGDRYHVKDFKLTGNLILPRETLKSLVTVRPGDIFSQKAATESADKISSRLADEGYAFAKVTPRTEIVPDTNDVNITFDVVPGDRVYVRRISFSGNFKTNDITLRRELRQFEGAWFSRAAVQRSRTRLARLPYVQSVDVSTKRVPGTTDLVDINFSIVERAPGSIQAGIGYSGAEGVLLTGAVTHTNFMGTGNRISLRFDNSSISKIYSASWTDPYATESGVSRTLSGYYQETNRLIRNSTGFDTDTLGLSLTYGIPLSEFSSLRLGGGLQDTTITSDPANTSQEVQDFVDRNGERALNFLFKTGITRDTRNRTIFATRGSLHELSLDVAVPGSDLTYYSSTYNYQQFIPFGSLFTLHFNGTVGYANGYSDSEVPPYAHFFAGGFESVRGYEPGSLGPRDSFDNPYGGTFKTVAQTDLLLPTPLASNNKSTRFTLFYDIGDVYAKPSDFDFSEMSSSAGLAFYWFTPFLGVLKLSYAVPIHEGPNSRVQRFQVSFGTGF